MPGRGGIPDRLRQPRSSDHGDGLLDTGSFFWEERKKLTALGAARDPDTLRTKTSLLRWGTDELRHGLAPRKLAGPPCADGRRNRDGGEQHLAQRIHDVAGLPRILDLREVIEQRAQACLDRLIRTFIMNYKSLPK
jgi:hypothetical protein